MPTAPRTSKVLSTITYTWSNSTNFDGFLVIGIVLPQASGVDWPSVAYGNQIVLEKLPTFYRIPIVDGAASQSSQVFYTSDIDPPNVKYVAWLFDRNMKKVTSDPVIGDAFTVTSDTFTPTVGTPTVPSVGTTIPSLDT
jgi:hypothetical protein